MDRNDPLIAELRARARAQLRSFERVSFDRGAPARTSPAPSVEARALLLATLQDQHRQADRRHHAGRRGDRRFRDRAPALPSRSALRLRRIRRRRSRRTRTSPRRSASCARRSARSACSIDGAADLLIVPARALFARLPRAGGLSRAHPPARGRRRARHARRCWRRSSRTASCAPISSARRASSRSAAASSISSRRTPPHAVRVELFGDTIDSLRWFDVETQRSEEASGPVTVYPMTQFPITRETRQKLARRLSLDFMDPLFKRDVARKDREAAGERHVSRHRALRAGRRRTASRSPTTSADWDLS